jgi:hypothetical protein
MRQPAQAARAAIVSHGSLLCRNCGATLIAGFTGLLAACGPVPYFSDLTMPCVACLAVNRVTLRVMAGGSVRAASERPRQ